MSSLLILGKGDTPYSDRNLQRLLLRAQQAGVDVLRCDYGDIRSAPNFRHANIKVMLFFPFTFWNAYCEAPADTRLYGTSTAAYTLFCNYFLATQTALSQRYGGRHQLDYIIAPEFAALDRDKIASVERLVRCGIATCSPIASRNLDEILAEIKPARGVYIKCRYGAEGKGITVLQHNCWRTNYKIEGNRLGNYGVNDHWPFTEITGRRELIEHLLSNPVIVEQEIVPPNRFAGEKFDIRAYVVEGAVPHFFMRVNNAEKLVTNYSQGARILHHPHTGLDETYCAAIRHLTLCAAQAFESRFLGVDIIFNGSADDARVLEVQTFTDFPDADKFDLVGYLIASQNL